MWTADSDGKASAARRPVVGADKVARLVLGLIRSGAAARRAASRPAIYNSAPALVLYLGDSLEGVIPSRSSTARSPTSMRCATRRSCGGGDHTARSAAAEFLTSWAMRIERLGDLGSAPAVLRAVGAPRPRLGLPPPAALIGDWFGSRAVIAPSVR